MHSSRHLYLGEHAVAVKQVAHWCVVTTAIHDKAACQPIWDAALHNRFHLINLSESSRPQQQAPSAATNT
jgi:hypothetical protein